MSAIPARINPAERAPAPLRGSLRVQGWIYTVINPLIEVCERDLRLLRAWNLSFSRVTSNTEVVRAGRDHLTPAGRLNLEDLARFHPAIGQLLEAQERGLFLAVEAARETQVTFVRHDGFRKAILKSRLHKERRDVPHDDLIADVAVGFINGGEEGEAWQELVDIVEQLPDTLVHAELRERVRVVAEATAKLEEALLALRVMLCDEFDLPPGPVPVHTIVDRR